MGATAATALGIAEKGYEISVTHAKEMIDETDQHGGMVIDAIYRGIKDVTVQATFVEWKAGPILAALPYTELAASGGTYLGPGVIARLDSAVAGVLILSATAATPAASAPATATATYSLIHENFSVQWALNSKLRRLPVKWRIYPYVDTVVKHMTFT